MRNIFVNEIEKMMGEDDKIVFLTAECGFNVVEVIKEKYPDRYYNTGIAEQSLVGTAAGMALRNLKPIAYTMAMFLTMRAYEQIRVDVAYQEMPVVLAGVIPGLGYGNSGTTHHSIEDAAILRVLPGMTIVYPSCEVDVREAVKQLISMQKPCYIGLGRNPANYSPSYSSDKFIVGKAIKIKDGEKIAVFSYGATIPNVVEAAQILESKDIYVSVYNMHTLKPLDTDVIRDAIIKNKYIVTVEEESIIGGLGSAIAECIAETGSQTECRLLRLGIPDTYGNIIGSQKYLHHVFGIDAEGIANRIKEIYSG